LGEDGSLMQLEKDHTFTVLTKINGLSKNFIDFRAVNENAIIIVYKEMIHLFNF
jgi:hypothetical protein